MFLYECRRLWRVRTQAAVELGSPLSKVSFGADGQAAAVLGHPVPPQQQEEAVGAVDAAVVAGTLFAVHTTPRPISLG